MKELLLATGLLVTGLVTSSCERQVAAQIEQPVTQLSPMITPRPAPDPEDANRPLPPIGPAPIGFPPPANPNAIISEPDAIQKALRTAAYRGEDNPTVVKSSVMSFEEALKLGSDPISLPEQDGLANIPVRVVEMKGTFKPRSGPPRRGQAPKTTRSFTKTYVFLRATDGLELGYSLSLE